MKKIALILSAVVMTAMTLSSCVGGASEEVIVGSQVWMTQNLNVDKFRNGDPIPEAKTDEEWKNAVEHGQPAWCYYDNDPANGAKYGKLYNWYAANDSRELAPVGYHIPSDEDWKALIDFLGGEDVAGTKMKSTELWIEHTDLEEENKGTNESGFSGLPTGFRFNDGTMNYIGEFGVYWSSKQDTANNAWCRGLHWASSAVIKDYNEECKGEGFSVRCIKD